MCISGIRQIFLLTVLKNLEIRQDSCDFHLVREKFGVNPHTLIESEFLEKKFDLNPQWMESELSQQNVLDSVPIF